MISLKVPGHRIDYVSAVRLRRPEFKVHEAGRQRCIREQRRNVHAWVVGEVEHLERGGVEAVTRDERYRRAVYDPWKGSTFVDAETFEPVITASEAVMVGKDVHYLP
ncbi:hypothetical protein [Actinocorallia libanotica]|uniref:hypothetical protein n=1 Tax=Actinocorallia libanotica TaxID=46162 RepID=UPI0031DE7967